MNDVVATTSPDPAAVITRLQRAGLKNWRIASEIGVSVDTLGRIRRGDRQIKPEECRALERLLEATAR